jgi:lipid-binding SYLF domain-containing protein
MERQANAYFYLATEDGFYTEEQPPANDGGPKQKQRVLKKIPQSVIENAVGLAIFTTMRTGLWFSGAGGSGVLVARQEDGSWSPPSGIMLHTAGLGFLVGVDIYDCVLVINNRKALEAFTKVRATLGGEISAVAGPVGIGGVLENDGKWKEANRPVFTYLKSRGFYAGVQVDGTIVIERSDENARFYGETIPVTDILAGKVRHPPLEIKTLMETLKAAEGRTDIDEALLEELDGRPVPGDVDVEAPHQNVGFGVPAPDDADPYGVLALEKEGLDIVEAGTRSRPTSEQFEYRPRSYRFSAGTDETRSTPWSDGSTRRSSQYTTDTSPETGDYEPVKRLEHLHAEAADVNVLASEASPYSSAHSIDMQDNEDEARTSLENGRLPSNAQDTDLSRGNSVRTIVEGTEEETGKPIAIPKGPPPPLPPRNSQEAAEKGFVDLDLSDTKQ